jgi:hypothetical protein
VVFRKGKRQFNHEWCFSGVNIVDQTNRTGVLPKISPCGEQSERVFASSFGTTELPANS